MAVGDATIVVTTHRVLVFTSGSGDRPRLRQLARPNVGSVEVASSGRLDSLFRAALLAVMAAIAAAVAVLVSFRDLVPDLEGADDESGVDGAPGTDVAGETLGIVETTFALIDVAVLSTAILAGIAACWYAIGYVRSRDRRLVLEVYGDDDVELPIDSVGVAAIELQTAIDTENALSDASAATPAGTVDPGRSPAARASDGEAPLETGTEAVTGTEAETGGDPAVDAYGIRTDADRGVSDDRSRSSTDSSRRRTKLRDADAAAGTDATTDDPGSFVFGGRTDEERAGTPEEETLLDGSSDGRPDDPFDGAGSRDASDDPFDDRDDSSTDPAPFDEEQNDRAGPSDDVGWDPSPADPDWATDDGRDRERDEALEDGVDSDRGFGADRGDDEVIDLSGGDDDARGWDEAVGDGANDGADGASDERPTPGEPTSEEPPTGDESATAEPPPGPDSSDLESSDDADDADEPVGR